MSDCQEDAGVNRLSDVDLHIVHALSTYCAVSMSNWLPDEKRASTALLRRSSTTLMKCNCILRVGPPRVAAHRAKWEEQTLG